MADLLQLGVSALNASRAKLQTVGHNISNADTEGYNRQQVQNTTTPAQNVGSNFFGTGVQVDNVRRVVDQFTIEELRNTSSNFENFDSVVNRAEQLDNLLGDESTSLSPSIERFFSSLQDASENPESTASRQMLMVESNLVVSRFESIANRLDDINTSLNSEMDSLVSELNVLGNNVADLNVAINTAGADDLSGLPNDLLDERDAAILRISELVSVSTTTDSSGAVNIFIGKGQALVIGNRSFEITTEVSTENPIYDDIVLGQGNSDLIITDSLSGGRIGGLLAYRSEFLEDSYNRLGLVALGLNDLMNQQHSRGMNLNNQTGGDFFVDVNEQQRMRSRVVADADNGLPSDRVMELEIDDITMVTISDYSVEFSPAGTGAYTITREIDDTEVARGVLSGVFPATESFDGMVLNFISGSFQASDSFVLQPTRNAARELSLSVNDVSELALAQPIRTETKLGNRGSGDITQGFVYDTETIGFNSEGTGLNPPLLIRFTSTRTYDVLDNSDPANPVALSPPLFNQSFTAGLNNNVFSEDEGQTSFVSEGSDIGVIQGGITSNNGYISDVLTVTTVDADSGAVTRQTLTTSDNDSAETIAQSLDDLIGITASAYNRATISNVRSTSPMNLTLNGQLLTGSDPDSLASSINNNAALQNSGISATSDGNQIELRGDSGVDFVFEVGGGAAGDGIDLTSATGDTYTISGNDATPAAVMGGLVSIVMDDNVAINGRGNVVSLLPTPTSSYRGFQVTLSGHPSEGDEFYVEFNTNGFADNRNVLEMAKLQQNGQLFNGTATLQEAYASMVNNVATKTQEASINQEASETLLLRAKQTHSEMSGVNLDEEAGLLIQYELSYNAAAQLITVGRNIIDTLINSIG